MCPPPPPPPTPFLSLRRPRFKSPLLFGPGTTITPEEPLLAKHKDGTRVRLVTTIPLVEMSAGGFTGLFLAGGMCLINDVRSRVRYPANVQQQTADACTAVELATVKSPGNATWYHLNDLCVKAGFALAIIMSENHCRDLVLYRPPVTPLAAASESASKGLSRTPSIACVCGASDGESVETAWAAANTLVAPVKKMGPGWRWASIDDVHAKL
ncbi:hypothetical protein B0H11DRAFT_1914577 [Mycena galericulata]|nr:hypothetical protein B0H11DRAFT_1914577 [Mycena galericulata]